MLEIPSRAALAALTEATAEIAVPVTLGITRSLDDKFVSVLYSTPHGIGEYVLPAAEVPPVVRIPQQVDESSLTSNSSGVIEWHLLAGGTKRIVSSLLSDSDANICFWAAIARSL